MLQKALVLVFVVASIASCISCGKTSSHYVYATIPAANQVKAYREDPNSGVLTEIQGSPYPWATELIPRSFILRENSCMWRIRVSRKTIFLFSPSPPTEL
jgi:hypothetical protein